MRRSNLSTFCSVNSGHLDKGELQRGLPRSVSRFHNNRKRVSKVLLAFLTTVLGSVSLLVSRPNRSAQVVQPAYKNSSLPVERRVEDLLGRMTLEEKIAQVHGIWKTRTQLVDEGGRFSPSKASELLKYGIGQISRFRDTKGRRESALFMNALQQYLRENTRLGIPVIMHDEGLHGHLAPGGTSFPQAIALASTWDVDLVERIFTVVAAQIRSVGSHQVFAPVLDLARDPRWGRTEETYGEDPHLASRIGVACVRGFQGRGPTIDREHVIATPKHFAVHGQPEGGTNKAPGNYSERIIREIFLPSFQSAVTEAGAMSIMSSYNEIDGIPVSANRWILQDILRQEWGFQGFVVSDYNAITQLETLHHVADSPAEAGKKALEAGVDVELPDLYCFGSMAQQIKDSKIAMASLDRAVSRVLRAKFLLGLFEEFTVDPEKAERIVRDPANRKLALEAAHKAIILLKNEGKLLPLDRTKTKTVAVIGPNADKCILGAYSGVPPQTISILQGIKDKIGNTTKITYAEGCKITVGDRGWWDDPVELNDPREDAKGIAEAAQIAKTADIAVVVVGDNEQTSREAFSDQHLGDRDSLDLVGQQDELVKAVVETGTPVVVVLVNAKPLSINYIAERVPAVLEAWYLGQETGAAVADVLLGDYNPAGRLPITIPRSVGQLPAAYNHKPSAKRGYLFTSKEPLFPFGHGLSYTTFEYKNLRLSSPKVHALEKSRVSVEITNTGAVPGDEVVQMYIRDRVSSVTRPVKELKGFRRITLSPGETQRVELVITSDALSFLNEKMERVVEPGMFDIMVGSSSVNLQIIPLEVVSR